MKEFKKKSKEIAIKCAYTKIVDPSTLVDHPRNANKHPDKQITALAGNIKEFGWRHPIVVSNLSGCIVMGHGRRDAALKLGCNAPADYQDFENEDEELAVLVADNIIPELAEKDEEMQKFNRELIAAAGYNLQVIGFDVEKFDTRNSGDDKKAPEISDDYNYSIVVECDDEDQQFELLQKFEEEGLKCRALIL